MLLRTYEGIIPSNKQAESRYTLTIYNKIYSGDGFFSLEIAHFKTKRKTSSFITYSGKRYTQRGIPGNNDATVWQLIASNKHKIFNLLVENENRLILLTEAFKKENAESNRTLELINSDTISTQIPISNNIPRYQYRNAYFSVIYFKEKGFVAFDKNGNELFTIYSFDNSPDIAAEGVFRIVNEKGMIGFADTLGNVILEPKYTFAYPFKDGRTKVTFNGKKKIIPESRGEYHYWESDDWYFLNKNGEMISICQ